MACPHCAARLIVRGSEKITLTVRELRMDCPECGARMIGQLSLIRVLRNSDCHNQEVRLPFSNPALQWDRRNRPANDDAPIPANDDAARAIRLYCEAIGTAATRGGREAVVASGADIGAMDEPLPEVAIEAAPEPEAPVEAAAETPAEAPQTAEAPKPRRRTRKAAVEAEAIAAPVDTMAAAGTLDPEIASEAEAVDAAVAAGAGSGPAAEDDDATASATPRRGWWQRTFGA